MTLGPRAMVMAAAAGAWFSASAQQTGEGWPVGAGDPTLCFAGNSYYVCGSGHGAPILSSTDLVTWRRAGSVFAALPDWARREIPESDGGCWAPDISCVDGEYRVYWSASSLGSRHSVIGLACNRTLDPASPDYRWEDRGRILGTTERDDWNAIDAQGFEDRDGSVWLVMGSYWSGIKIRRLDRKTGRLAEDAPTLHSLARRPDARPPSIEGAYLVRHGDFYYLFVSFGSCMRGAHSDYHIRVGRSRSVTGPYADRDGRPMMEGGGTLVLQSHGATCGPGHNSVLQRDGRSWLACHRFDPDAGGRRVLQIRPLFWDDEGWPVPGEPVGPPAAPRADAAGKWLYSLDYAEPRAIALNPDGTIGGHRTAATWERRGDRIVLAWHRDGGEHGRPLEESCQMAPDGAWFVGRNRYGQIVRGVRAPEGAP